VIVVQRQQGATRIRLNRTLIRSAIVEVLVVLALLNAFATYKLYRRVSALAKHVVAYSEPAPAIDVSIDGEEIKGSESAPVTIVEFTDYECSMCGMYFEQTYPQIHRKYVETGIVRVVVRNFPIKSHPQAHKAAEAAECAGDQGNYWEMHRKLFENQASLSVDNYKQWAREIGLDGTSFDECLDSGAMVEEVKKDIADGSSYGLPGTPVFFINGRMLVGAQSFEAFESVIQKELQE
jgi:protein-disulfide isomerase